MAGADLTALRLRASARYIFSMNAPADRLAIALAQLNPTVGDVTGNAEKVRRARAQAKEQGAELVIFPELFIAGYPPEDLVLKPAFQSACRSAVEALARETADGGPAVLVGVPWVDEKKLYNAYLLLEGGRIAAARYKVELPNYGVFDEKRVFESGPLPGPIVFKGVRIGIPICEDIWHAGRRRMHFGDRRRNPAGPERFALSSRQDAKCASTSRSRAWSRADFHSSISTWSAGRTSLFSTAVRFA